MIEWKNLLLELPNCLSALRGVWAKFGWAAEKASPSISKSEKCLCPPSLITCQKVE